MYLDFFGFKEKPFNLVPNPAYLYLSEKHANALTFLEYGLKEKIGFVMLTGEIGIGKTTLVRHLLNQVEAQMDVAVIFNTNVLSDDLINLILTEFEIEYKDGITKSKALEALYAFLIDRYAKGRKVLLIIDEAQNLSKDVLEEIRMLSNLQTDDDLLLQIMIVGQPELKEKIADPRLEQFAQRIAISYHLAAINLTETQDYISHRVQKAGGEDELFAQDAVKKIYEVSQGIPRTINLLCDAALVYAYADEKTFIDSALVDQVVEDKGGMGVFTKAKIKPVHTDSGEQSSAPQVVVKDLLERMAQLESRFSAIEDGYTAHIAELESRAQFCRNEMVAELKSALNLERDRNDQISSELNTLKERYRLLTKYVKKIDSDRNSI